MSCKNRESFEFKKIGESTFDIGFIANHRFIGITVDNKNEDLFFFGDPVTRKIIKFYSVDGTFKFTTSLKKASDTLRNIQHFEIVSPDTILIFGQFNNQIAVVNRYGDIWYYLNLNTLIKPYQNFNLNYVPSYGGPSISGDRLFLNIEYLSKSKTESTPRLKDYFPEALNAPFFVKITNLFNESDINYEFGLFSFYRRFMNDTMAMGELVRYSVLDSNVIVFSSFSDSLYRIDDQSMNINQAFPVESEYTEIKANPIYLTSEDDYSRYYEDNVKFKGYISKVFEDKRNQFYVVSIACEKKKKTPIERDYSYCFYTKNGAKLYELLLKKEEYIPSLLYFSKGIYYLVPRSSVIRSDNRNIFNFENYEIRY